MVTAELRSKYSPFSRNRLTLSLVLAVFILAGCETRYQASFIHPHPPGKPFQECSVDLEPYKSVQTRQTTQNPNLALALAVSGGGLRAANLTAGVMLGLEKITKDGSPNKNVLNEVDYFSTVSGGGFAVATYISTLHDHLSFGGSYNDYSFNHVFYPPSCPNLPPTQCPYTQVPPSDQTYDPCIKWHLQQFYHKIAKMVLTDILPWEKLGLSDRGSRLEQAIDDDLLGYKWRLKKFESLNCATPQKASLTLGDIFVPRDEQTDVKLPYWLTNATVYENGTIFTFTPEHFQLYDICSYEHRFNIHKYDPNKQDYTDFAAGIPLSLGARASSTFPIFMPPTLLRSEMDPHNPYLYLLDGGVADNLGITTAIRLLENEPYENVTHKTLIVIDAFNGTFASFSNVDETSIFTTGLKLTKDTFIDSQRGRYREIVNGLCQSKNIHPLYISFHDLANLSCCCPLIDFGLTSQNVTALYEQYSQDPEFGMPPTPFKLLRSISTISTKLSPAQQNLLLAAGKYLINQKRDDIQQQLGWK
ncbi:MAG: patatin-like phospholipase family protein [Planctomycetota bacterium]|jgi:hypothetical protein